MNTKFDEVWDAFDSLSDDLHKLEGDVDAIIQKLNDRIASLELKTIQMQLEYSSPDPLGEALNSGDGSYKP